MRPKCETGIIQQEYSGTDWGPVQNMEKDGDGCIFTLLWVSRLRYVTNCGWARKAPITLPPSGGIVGGGVSGHDHIGLAAAQTFQSAVKTRSPRGSERFLGDCCGWALAVKV